MARIPTPWPDRLRLSWSFCLQLCRSSRIPSCSDGRRGNGRSKDAGGRVVRRPTTWPTQSLASRAAAIPACSDPIIPPVMPSRSSRPDPLWDPILIALALAALHIISTLSATRQNGSDRDFRRMQARGGRFVVGIRGVWQLQLLARSFCGILPQGRVGRCRSPPSHLFQGHDTIARSCSGNGNRSPAMAGNGSWLAQILPELWRRADIRQLSEGAP